MRNLQLLSSLQTHGGNNLTGVQHMSVDYDTGIVYCATSSSIQVLDQERLECVQQVSLVEAGYLPSDGSGKLVGLQYLPDQMSACVSTSTGDVVVWNPATSQVECVGTVDSGLRAMEWSPDHELLVLATGQDTLILMTREFDPITEVNMQPEDFGDAKFVSVGWGKKETQFHGSEGKQAALKKQEDIKPAFAWDDAKVRISWHGDGQYFVISHINQASGARQLRIWSREMVLYSTSENVDGLEQALAWKPSGRLIASSQRRPNKHDIVFFEKNGLRHGEFTLPFGVNEVKVLEVEWNNDSNVLMVWCEERQAENTDEKLSAPKSYVQLWTVSNYHWYLKQSLLFDGGQSEQVAVVQWDPDHAYRLHLVCAGGQYLQYHFSWTTHQSRGQSATDLAPVAVIDGNKVLVTPFRSMVVPPPMCAYHLQLSTQVNAVTFGPPSHPNDMAILLADGSLAVYKYISDSNECCPSVKVGASGGSNFKVQCQLPMQVTVFKINLESDLECWPLQLYHMTWVDPETVMACGRDGQSRQNTLYLLQLVYTEACCRLVKTIQVPGTVIGTAPSVVTGRVVLQLSDGTLLLFTTDTGTLEAFTDQDGRQVCFPQPCSQMAVCYLGGQEVVLGLTDRFRFYVNDVEVANNCTSFALHNEFLLLSTHAHTCRYICRNTQLKELPTLVDGKAHPFDESVRRVERGSRIVHVVSDDTKLILQMPRGNLETIHPRALVLAAVRKGLDRMDFSEAFNLMRKHRINLNLIYDHNPDTFLNNVDVLVHQLASVNNLSLFITDLQEEDVTITMYMEAYNRTKNQQLKSSKSSVSKVDIVCDALREVLVKTDQHKYLHCILTTYVKKTNPDLEVALCTIKTLKEREDVKEGLVKAEEALKYLIFLVDVNELFDHALGTYDFDLVLMVAEKSQKDPKEYLPFLNNLRKMETNYQRYSIDLYLKRYSRALEHITKCEDHFTDCLALVKQHNLYAAALRLFQVTSQQYKDIAVAYGDFLKEKSLPDEAAIMFCRAEEWASALSAFQQCLNWRQAIVTAHKLNYSREAIAQMSADLARRLCDAWRYAEAACLLEQYAEDVEQAIVTLIDGEVWEEALRLMYKYNRTDFIETHFKDALVKSFQTHEDGIESIHRDFERHRDRLAVVRQQKEEARLELLEGGGEYNTADADLFSDTSSATGESVVSSRYSGTHSMRSSSSRRSGKARRKMERKQWSLKEGSRHEDLALIEALSKLCKQADSKKEETHALLQMLVLFHEESKASVLQAKFDRLLSVIGTSIAEIWDPLTEAVGTAITPALGPEATTNSIIAAMRAGEPVTTEVKLDPSVRVPPAMDKDRAWRLHSLSELSH